MFQVVTTWNLTRPDQDMIADFSSLERRGYNPEAVSLTGQLAVKIADKVIFPLSVGDIADKRCPTRRDLYLRKGVGRLSASHLKNIEKATWGHKAGSFVEKYFEGIGGQQSISQPTQSYTVVRNNGDNYHQGFIGNKTSDIAKLQALERSTFSMKEGDTDWLLRLLKCNGRIELGTQVFHSFVKEIDSLDSEHIEFKKKLHPKPRQIGINSPATPDFIVPHLSVVGDIKTSIGFEAHFQLTCAGYALSYENEYGEGQNINWGIIYLLPTRNPTALVRPLTFAQIYIFPIDDNLRSWFLDERDKSHRVLSGDQIPNFPTREEDIKTNCPYCKLKAYCEQHGLQL